VRSEETDHQDARFLNDFNRLRWPLMIDILALDSALLNPTWLPPSSQRFA
jgi:hypothetical protein